MGLQSASHAGGERGRDALAPWQFRPVQQFGNGGPEVVAVDLVASHEQEVQRTEGGAVNAVDLAVQPVQPRPECLRLFEGLLDARVGETVARNVAQVGRAAAGRHEETVGLALDLVVDLEFARRLGHRNVNAPGGIGMPRDRAGHRWRGLGGCAELDGRGRFARRGGQQQADTPGVILIAQELQYGAQGCHGVCLPHDAARCGGVFFRPVTTFWG